MAKKSKDLEILLKLATSGNFDAAHKELERLKNDQQGSVKSLSTFQKAWQAWTSGAVTSAGAIRAAWMTALGPISALIVIFQTLKSTIGFVFTAVSNYRKAQAETNETVQKAANALENARFHKEKYADAKGVEALNAALKAHQKDLEEIAKQNADISKKVEGAGKQWWNIGDLISANNRKLLEQLPALAKAEIELKKEIFAREEALELAKKQEEAEKKRIAAVENVTKRIKELTLSESDFKLWQLEEELKKYEAAGVSKTDIDQLRALATTQIAQDAANKITKAEQDKNDKIEQINNELDQKMASLGNETLQSKLEKIRLEEQAENAKNKKLLGEGDAYNKTVLKNAQIYAKKSQDLYAADAKFKIDTTLSVMEQGLEALSILNSSEEIKTKEDARRAKIILAIQQAIAIAKLWAAESGKGWAGIAIAAAGTAVIAAQFAVQSKAIDKARKEAGDSQSVTSVVNSTEIGEGTTVETTTGGTSSAPSGSSSSSSAASSAASSATIQPIINVYCTLNLYPESLDVSDRNAVLGALLEELRGKATAAGVQFALVLKQIADKNAGLAV